MEASAVDDEVFFPALARSGARVLLIGRRALVALGAPLMTVDVDLWVHFDDVELLNAALASLDQSPNRTPADARARGRYVIENGERVDVVVARAATDPTGVVLTFDDAWTRRQEVVICGATVALPSIEDLIVTKRWGSRPKDMVDIQWLTELKRNP